MVIPLVCGDVSRITNFERMFDSSENTDDSEHYNLLGATFNEDLSTWDVSRATCEWVLIPLLSFVAYART